MHTSIYDDEIEHWAGAKTNVFWLSDGRFRARLKHLDPHRTWHLHVHVWPKDGERYSLACQDTTYSATGSQIHHFPLDPTRPVVLQIEAPPGTAVRPTVFTPDDDVQTVNSRFALLAYTPQAQYNSAIIGQAILGAFELPQPRRQGTILGNSRLGSTTLASAIDTHSWHNIMGAGTHITTSRGVDFNGFTSRADVGTLTFTAYNAHAPAASKLARGVPLVLVDVYRRRPLFTGTIDKTIMTPAKDGTYTVQVTALDRLAEVAATRKYQNTRPVGVSWRIAIREIVEGKYPFFIKTHSDAHPLIGSLVKEGTAVDYLDIYTATVGAHWFADCSGQLIFTDSLPLGNTLTVSDSPTAVNNPMAVSPVDIEATFDTSSIISVLEATNNSAAKDDSGQWQSATATVKVENLSLAKNYGVNSLNIETCAVSALALRDHLKTLMGRYAAAQTIKQANFALIDDNGIRHELDRILPLEILDPVNINFRNSTTTAAVSHINYDITPTEARATIEFINTKGN